MGAPKHETEQLEPSSRYDGMSDDWARILPFERPRIFDRGWLHEEIIRVDEFRQDGALVVKAELPGIDPDKDVELTVSDGLLHIQAERRDAEQLEEREYVRHELRHGSLTRTLPLPDDVSEADIQASYKGGILEIRVPAPAPEPAKKAAVTKG